MVRSLTVCGLVLLAVALSSEAVAGQAGTDQQALNLFLDCQRSPGCFDDDYLRREVPFVNWVRDREASDLHVLITSQGTGGGGRLYTFDFIGIGDFEGQDQQLSMATSGDATNDEEREGVAGRLRLGLVRYVMGTPVADQLRVTFGDASAEGGTESGPGGAGPATSPEDDPWDFWTFQISGNGFVNGESTVRFSNTSASFRADRTTELWKVNFRSSFSQNVQEFEIPDSSEPDGFRVVNETREDWNLSGSLVRSIGEQWAIGVRSDAGSSTFLNQDLRVGLKPGVEFNFVPYSESSRRSITLQYLVGPTHFAYTQRTIFEEMWETRMQHSLTGRVSLVQPWGRWSTTLSSSQYLHDTEKYNVSLSGNINVRLFRGFSVRIGGNYSWIRDQLHLSGAGFTDEEVLLRQRQLETSYRYFTSFGIEYRFGSIFNNVVNPRFGGPGGGGEVFFF